MSKYFMKNNEKVRGVTPDYEKMQADSSHQQQQRLYQKVLLGYCSGMLYQGTQQISDQNIH